MIIGLGHQARVGKDTIAEHLVEQHGFVRLAFADALKSVAYAANPNVGGHLYLQDIVGHSGWEVAKSDPGVRRFLQNLGVAAREHIDQNVWVRIVLDQAGKFVAYDDTPVVITDVRFPNEFQALDTAGAHLVKVVRPGVESNAGSHISETALADAPWHGNFFNNGTLEELHLKVDAYLADLKQMRAA